MQFQAERIQLQNLDPTNLQKALGAILGISRYVRQSGLEESLLNLVTLRASQINGCAYCIDMHYKDARAQGESDQRLYSLDAWRECPYYTERERAALSWTEAVTLIAADRVPDAVYDEVRPWFNDDELVALTMAIISINGFNRLNIALRTVPGGYEVSNVPAEERATALVS
jgi:AhpD family alkylhydroperoxidase